MRVEDVPQEWWDVVADALDREQVASRRRQVYTMIGNDPFDACMHRIQQVIWWGGEPYAQPFMKLNALVKRPHVRFDWTEAKLKAVQRWVNGRFWKYTDFDNYRASIRTLPQVAEQMEFAP